MSTTILLRMLKEIGMALIGRIAFKVVLERLATRQVVRGLRWLQARDTNDLYSEEVDMIIDMLKKKRLAVADEK